MVQSSKSSQNAAKQHQHVLQYHQTNSVDDGEQPAKFLKVFNGNGGSNGNSGGAGNNTEGGGGILREYVYKDDHKINGSTIIANATAAGTSPSNGVKLLTTNTTTTNGNQQTNVANELCRLPGGAELNILPTSINNGSISSSNAGAFSTITSNASMNLHHIQKSSFASVNNNLASAFYHGNGKITFVNSPTSNMPGSSLAASNGTCVTATNGIMLKDSSANGLTSLLIAASGVGSPTTTTSLSSTPTATIPTTVNNHGLQFANSFAQLLAAANSTTASLSTSAPSHSVNGGGGGSGSGNVFALNGVGNMAGSGGLNVSSLSLSSSTASVDMSRTKINSKSSIVGWRSGAATTIN